MNGTARFIVLEGGEGCGKSTQAALLQRKLEEMGQSVLLVRDPGTTRIGEQIRTLLLNPANTEMAMRCEMLLYMAARAQMMKEVIAPALAKGMTVISDRWIASTLAYQGGGDGLTDDEILATARVALGGRDADVTLIFDMPTAESSKRVQAKFILSADAPGEKDRIERRPMEYHEKVRANYLRLAEREPSKYRVIKANRPELEVAAAVWAAVASSV